jgi:hypothetical protein
MTLPRGTDEIKKAEQRFRAELAREFRRVVESRFHADVAAAADDIGISRQRLEKYLMKGMTPKADVLLLMMIKWRLRLTYEGVEISAMSRRRPNPAPPSQQLKLDLFDAPEVCWNEDRSLEVRVKRKMADRLALAVEIRMAG